MNCGKCSRDISIAKDAAKCVECGLSFHVTCCRIRTLAKLTSMSARNLASWKCDDCSQDSSSVASHKSDSVDPNISDILLAIQKEIAVSQAANRDGFSAIEQRLTGLQASVDEFHKRLSSLEAENVELKAECVEPRTKNESLSRRVFDVELQMADIQQYSRNHNIEVMGVPVTKNSLYPLPIVCRHLGGSPSTPLSSSSSCPAQQRLNGFLRPRKKRIKTTDLAASLPPAPVLVLDHLTPQNKHILGRAKSLVKDGQLAFAWSRDGKVLVRQTVESPARRVRSIDEVEAFVRPVVSGSPTTTQ
ncbi:hypothetical protein J6590_096499 [Homalodisca vitripennis]|nr:hypothetical protein J6590_096499 [Homalodisca vitripennis]